MRDEMVTVRSKEMDKRNSGNKSNNKLQRRTRTASPGPRFDPRPPQQIHCRLFVFVYVASTKRTRRHKRVSNINYILRSQRSSIVLHSYSVPSPGGGPAKSAITLSIPSSLTISLICLSLNAAAHFARTYISSSY